MKRKSMLIATVNQRYTLHINVGIIVIGLLRLEKNIHQLVNYKSVECCSLNSRHSSKFLDTHPGKGIVHFVHAL